jgi:hypothetical protein
MATLHPSSANFKQMSSPAGIIQLAIPTEEYVVDGLCHEQCESRNINFGVESSRDIWDRKSQMRSHTKSTVM